uniref:BTB domain-containing protein n=1 Tax=Panagrolaimus davidi TaxID=227884 RepID=A0A914QHU5_9BILA
MRQNVDLIETVGLCQYSQKIVKFSDDFQFTVKRKLWTHNIYKTKGEFEITKITEVCDNGVTREIEYDKASAEFSSSNIRPSTFKFYITANIKMKEMCVAGHHLQINCARFQCLKLCHFFKGDFSLHGYDSLKFTYYVKKIKADFSEGNDIEIDIVNPYDVEILGKKGDYKIKHNSSKRFDLYLTFSFYPDILDKLPSFDDENFSKEVLSKENYEPPISNETCSLLSKIFESAKHSSNNESRPESVVSQIPLNDSVPKFFKLGPHLRYSDVYFIASDKTKVPSHRCILAEFSETFVKIFDEASEIPVHIFAENFNAETIQSALNYLYGKTDAVYGKEVNVLKFAITFRIQHLINVCVSTCEELISVTNVCEFIQIAYANNFEELKQKCLKVLIENKEDINPAKIAEIPKNILYDAFFFKL